MGSISPVTMWRDESGRWQLVAMVLINGQLEILTTL